MTENLRGFWPLSLGIDQEAALPLYRQVYGQIREAVLSGRLPAGARLPSSRSLASELGCARNTIITAYDQLLSEGYLEGQVGSGTFVSRTLPEGLLSAPLVSRQGDIIETQSRPLLSRRGTALASFMAQRGSFGHRRAGQAFQPGLPDVSSFPFEVWGRLLGRAWRHPAKNLDLVSASGGYPPLRRAIAQYLRGVRAVDCTPEQILITSGTQQALDLAARLLLDPGDQAWVEEPGYPGLCGALLAAGAVPVPVPIDEEGLSLEEGKKRAPEARLIALTPSHQYPLGTTMSLSRRLAILDWARDAEAWVLEDDYDSEYRYAGRPLAALQGLDEGNRVIYAGTFSKVLFPGLRLGYLVVPDTLVDAFVQARAALDDYASLIAQPALATFLEEGHFTAHLRRMRRLYAARQEALLEAGKRHLHGLLDLSPDQAGLHLVAGMSSSFTEIADDKAASARAAKAGVVAPPLSRYYMDRPDRQGLLLGYASLSEAAIEEGARRLAGALVG